MANTNALQQNTPASAFYSSEELLRFLIERDNLSLDGVVNDMKKSERQKILDSHPYKIFLAKDGRWRTCVSDDSKKDGRRHIAKTTLDDLYDAIVEYYEKQEENKSTKNITLEKLYPQWLEFKRLHTKTESYIYRITTEWLKYYQGTPIVKIPVARLTKLQLDEWAHRLIKDNDMTKKQYYNTSVIMRQMLKYACDLEIICDSPFDKVRIDGGRMFRRVPKPASETQVFSSEELDLIHQIAWDSFHSRRNYKHQLIPLAVMFFFQTGMRISEICSLKYSDIEGEDLHVQSMYSDFEHEVKDRTKGYFGDRYVPLTDDARHLIETARNRQQEEGVSDCGYIFSMTCDPIPYSELRKTFIKYCNDADILPRSSRKARKTVISTLIDDSVNINTIREMVGHIDEKTTYNNYCFDRSEKTERRNHINSSLSRAAG